MTVELRSSMTAHGLKPPSVEGTTRHSEQLSDMLELCQGAKQSSTFDASNASSKMGSLWPERVKEILEKHSPFSLSNIDRTLREFGFNSWSSCVDFVMDDNCPEFALIVLRWGQHNGLQHQQNNGFIDGDGTGYTLEYLTRLASKSVNRGSLEKAFDAKYYYKQRRPLVILSEKLGEEAASCLVNYVHPGHWAYPAGHSTKFFQVVELAKDYWILSDEDYSKLLTAAYVLSMARSGGGVHFPEDNVAGGYIVGLPEFSQFGI